MFKKIMSLESRKPFMSAVRSRTGAVTGNTNKKSTRFLPRLNPNFSNNSQWAKNNLPIFKKNSSNCNTLICSVARTFFLKITDVGRKKNEKNGRKGPKKRRKNEFST